MSERAEGLAPDGFVPDLARYEPRMGVARQRLTARRFNPDMKALPQIVSWDRFDMANSLTAKQIDA